MEKIYTDYALHRKMFSPFCNKSNSLKCFMIYKVPLNGKFRGQNLKANYFNTLSKKEQRSTTENNCAKI